MAAVFGRFDPLGYFTRLNGHRREEIAELLSLLGAGQNAPASGRSFAPLGTLLHEAVHCVQIASTPFGQYWTRALLSQGLFTSLIFRGVFEGRTGTPIELPLNTGWQAAAGADSASLLAGMRGKWRVVDELLAALVSPTNLSINEACAIHSDTLRFVAQFGFLDRVEERRDAAMPRLASSIGDLNANPMWDVVPITTANLVETHARILESEFLKSQGDTESARQLANQSDAAQDTVVLKVLAGHHGELYSYPAEMLHTAIALIELALFAPIDPALAPLWSNVLLWEDIHPAYRFFAAANITKEVGLLTELDDLPSYQNEVCRLAGWHTPAEIIEVLLPRLTGRAVYDRFFATCLEWRREHPLTFSCGLNGLQDFWSPITIYDDQLVVKESALNPPEAAIANAGQLLEAYAVRELAQQLLFDRKIVVPEPLSHTGLSIDDLLLKNFFVRVATGEE